MLRISNAGFLILTIVVVVELSSGKPGVGVVVNTETGQIAGEVNGTAYETACFFPPVKYLPFTGAPNVAAFLGIPYAEAPVGDLRFRPTAARKSWSGVLQAKKTWASMPSVALREFGKDSEAAF